MKKKKVLFIASLPTAKLNFDGERNKSRDIFCALVQSKKFSVTTINFSKNKYIQMAKMLILHLINKYDFIFVSKCIVGGSKAIHFLNKIKKTNCYFYIIGNGYYGFDEKQIHFDDIKTCNHLIVESEEVKKSMIKKGISKDRIDIFPCLKPTYDLPVVEKDYSSKRPLKLLYFSRINPDKGLGDLLEVVIELNKKETLFILDIAGGVSNEPGIKEFNDYVICTCQKYDYLNYLGMNLRINGLASYKEIQKYDLHVFPSRFKQECAPGSILDMFVAGVPTLSSKFPSYGGLLDNQNSILFEQGDNNDLKEKLLYIYKNRKILNQMRHLSNREYYKYTDIRFLDFLSSMNFG